jgi:hypothetical protein
VLVQLRHAHPGHGEVAGLGRDGEHRGVGVTLEGGADDVPVEEVVEGLVRRHPAHDGLAGEIGERPTCVPVGDSRRELLQGDIDEGFEDVGGGRSRARRHVTEPGVLERFEVDGARHGQVVPDDRGVTHLSAVHRRTHSVHGDRRPKWWWSAMA